MIEYEDELESVEEIILNPQKEDRLTCERWLKSNSGYIPYIWFDGNQWMRPKEEHTQYCYTGTVTIKGYQNFNTPDTHWIKA